jgi:hypothetical protein
MFEIKTITGKEGLEIIEKRKPLGHFIIEEENGTFTGIDNSTSDAWTEEFKKKENCISWLNGKPLEDILEDE